MAPGSVVDAQLADAVAWLGSDDAHAAARSELGRRGLPTGADAVDEVLADAGLRVLERLRRRGPLAPVDAPGPDAPEPDAAEPDAPEPDQAGPARAGPTVANVVGYCRAVVRFATLDVLAGVTVRSLDELVEDGRRWATSADDLVPPEAPADVGLDGRAAADALRLGLHAGAADGPAWVVSAGCVMVALATDDAVEVEPGTPRPAVGDEARRWRWAGLHYAGRHDCLPDVDGSDDAARRQRRARALAVLDDALRQASAVADREVTA